MDAMLFPSEALALLRDACYDPEAHCGFAGLPCGFNWSDELLVKARPICLAHGSRADFYLMAYRSSLIRGEPIEEYLFPWDQLQAACPDWPGFRPERCNTELARSLERISAWTALIPDDASGLLRACLFFVCALPLVIALPVGVQLIALNLRQDPTSPWLLAGIGSMFAGFLFCEFYRRMVAGTFGVLSEVAVSLGAHGRGPAAIEMFMAEAVMVFGQRVMAILMFAILMDGGAHFRACCFAYLGYEVGAILLLAGRWKSWTKVELFYLRWGWAPIIAFGVPWLLPALKAMGLIRVFA